MGCHRHPEREARRSCHRCHQPLCLSCEVRAGDRLFCSRHCLRLQQAEEVLRQDLSVLGEWLAIPAFSRVEVEQAKPPLVSLALLSLALLLSQSRIPPLPSIPSPRPLEASYTRPFLIVAPRDHAIGTVLPASRGPLRPAPSREPRAIASLPAPRSMPHSEVSVDCRNQPSGGEAAPDISRGPRSPKIALTFDGGKWANLAPEILAILREKGISCTFFLTGEFILRYPDWVQEMVADGQEIANHTHTHPHLTSYGINARHELLPGVDRQLLTQELRETEGIYHELTGKKMAPFWRSPYGEQNAELRRWAQEAGYQHVSWTSDPSRKFSLDSRDWVADPRMSRYSSAEEVRDRLLGCGDEMKGGIILMHLNTARTTDRVHERLGEIIDGLQARGYRFVKVSELMEEGGEGKGS